MESLTVPSKATSKNSLEKAARGGRPEVGRIGKGATPKTTALLAIALVAALAVPGIPGFAAGAPDADDLAPQVGATGSHPHPCTAPSPLMPDLGLHWRSGAKQLIVDDPYTGHPAAVDVDQHGYVYHVGTLVPPSGSPLTMHRDAYLKVVAPDGTTVVAGMRFDWGGHDYGSSVHVVPSGHVVVAGLTDLGQRHPIYGYSLDMDAFVAVVCPWTGASRTATLGGSNFETDARARMDDATGDVYLAMQTASTDVPFTVMGPGGGMSDIVVAKYDFNLAFLESSYMHTPPTSGMAGFEVDEPGGPSAPDTTLLLGMRGTLAPSALWRIDSSLNVVAHIWHGPAAAGTGAGLYDIAHDPATDEIHLVGTGTSTMISGLGAFQPPGGGLDILYWHLDHTGIELRSSWFGGPGDEIAVAIDYDSSGIVLGGYAIDSSYPSVPPPSPTMYWQPVAGGASDVFIGRIAPSGMLDYATYLGDGQDDMLYDVAIGNTGMVYGVGFVAGIPPTPLAYNPLPDQGFVARFG